MSTPADDRWVTARDGAPDPSWAKADQAVEALALAREEPDSAKRAEHLKAAVTLAVLSHRDALGETSSLLKEIANGPLLEAVQSVTEASETIKKATNHLVAELRKSQVKAVEEAA